MGIFLDNSGVGVFTVPGELDAYMLSRGHTLITPSVPGWSPQRAALARLGLLADDEKLPADALPATTGQAGSLANWNVLPGNTAADNSAGFAAAAASGASDFYLPSGSYQVALTEGQSLMQFTGRTGLRIHGDNAVLIDSTTYTMQATFTSMFQLDNCRDVDISGIRYQGPVLATPATQLGYQGGLFVRILNGGNGIRVDAELANLRYGVQVGDYAIPSRGGCRNLDVTLRCTMVGYPLAAYLADGIRHDIDADGVHRATYIAGCNDVSGTVRFKDQYIADKAYLITDVLTSGTDAAAQADPVGAATTSRGCSNVEVSVIDKGSTVMPASASVAGLILSRVDPVKFSNIRVNVYTKSTDTVSRYFGGFHIASDAKTVWSRYPFNWEPHVTLENISVSGVVDHSAQTLSGNTAGDVYVVARESTHAATVRNFRLDGLTVLRSSGGVRACYFEAPGLSDLAHLDVVSPGQTWNIDTNATSVVRMNGPAVGAVTPAGASRVQFSGDTGWRTVTSASANLTGTFAVRRRDDVVEMICISMTTNATPASPETMWTAPGGFRPYATMRGIYGQAGGTPSKLFALSSAGAAQFFSLAVSSTVQLNLSWTTTDPWPTSLPGV